VVERKAFNSEQRTANSKWRDGDFDKVGAGDPQHQPFTIVASVVPFRHP